MNRMRKWLFSVVVVAFACVAAACDDDPEPLEPATWLPPVVLDGYVVLVDVEHDRVHVIDVRDTESLHVERDILPANPTWAARRTAHPNEALILAAGLRGVEPGATLSVIDQRARRRTYDLEAPFNRVIQSDDGRYAVAYYERGSRDPLFSPNRIAVIDLHSEDRAGAVAHTTLRTPNGSLLEVAVSPELRAEGLRAHVAIGLSAGYVSVLDLAHPERADILIELGTGAVVPKQVVFSADSAQAYVRAAGSDDAFVLRLREADDERENDFWPAVDQVPIAAAFDGLAVAGAGSSDRLLALSAADQALHVVDRVTGRSHRIDLDRPATELLGMAIADGDEDEGDRLAFALAFAPGAPDVTLIDARDLPGAGTAALTELTTELPVAAAVVLEEQGRVLLHHAGSAVVSVVDVRARRLSTLSLTEPLSGLQADERFETLLVAPPGAYQIGTADLDTGETRVDLLDAPVAHAAVTARDQIAVVHPDDTLTLIDLGVSDPDAAARTFEFR